MAQWIRALTVKKWWPGTHEKEKEENWHHKVVLWSPYMYCGLCMCTNMQTHTCMHANMHTCKCMHISTKNHKDHCVAEDMLGL